MNNWEINPAEQNKIYSLWKEPASPDPCTAVAQIPPPDHMPAIAHPELKKKSDAATDTYYKAGSTGCILILSRSKPKSIVHF